MNVASSESLVKVILEEIGHYVDAQINLVDSAGDEGAIFAALVLGETLSTQELQALKAEDDTAYVTLNGQQIQIEQANFTGTNGNDNITGTSGDDIIQGLGGNDTLSGLGGNDSLNGGVGNDTLSSDAGNDTINGGTGFDYYKADYSNRTTGLTMTYDPTTGNGTITVGTEVDTLISIESFDAGFGTNGGFKGTNFDDFIVGTSNNENYFWYGIFGLDGNDTVSGGGGDDKVFGGEGNDVVNGDTGNDELYGENGNDTLQGTNNSTGEQDYLEGGTGNDLFILADTTKTFYDDGNATNAGTNDYARIADFNTTDDIIQLRGSSSDYLLTVSGSNTNLYINKPGTEPDELIAVINNQTALSLTASYFSYVSSPTLPTITLAVSPTSVTEDGTANLVYTFTRTGSTTSALTVNYTVGGTATNGTDYTSIPTSVTFAANSSTATVTVDPTADTIVESNETVILTLATGTGYTIGTPNTATGTILDDDTPNVTLSLNYSGISEDSPSNFVYTFTRTGATTNALTVNYNIAGTGNATDYTGATPGNGKTITFNPGSTTTSITIDPTADTVVEPNETISLQLAAGTGYSIATTAAQIATIINDDGTRRHLGTNGKDVLLGTNANDYLIGGAGDDILTGGTGGDIFYFASSNLGNDAITDFTPGQDFIQVSGQGFGGGLIAGDTITAAQFLIGSSATNASQRFIYNSTSGALLFDVDGNGIQSPKQIATLNTGLAITYEDIFVS